MTQNKKRILVVDDKPNNLQLIQQTLEDQYQLAFATSGPKALEIVSKLEPDLILLDIMMPDMDGYEVCEHLKADEQTRDIPIIFVTAMGDETDETKGLEMGAVDYIIKPISRPIVKARVKNHLELKQAREDLEDRNRFIKKIFGRYLSDEIVKNILETPKGLSLGGERREVTVLITDLRGFTSMCERMAPEEVVGTLNIFLEAMIKIILKYGGTIDEIIGDGLFVIFNAPIFQDDHALRAVTCALEMQLAMPEVNQLNLRHGYPEIKMGIGINTGEVVVGNIGSERRTKYGLVGRHVNMTARIESYTLGGQILVSKSTRDACGSLLKIDDEQEVMAKGVDTPIAVSEVRGIGGKYNLFLPEKEKIKMAELHPICPVRLHIITDKHAGPTAYAGEVVRLGPDGMEVQCERTFRPLTDLKILLSEINGRKIADDLYGKVVKVGPSNTFRIHFTSVPPSVAAYVRKIGGEI